MKRPAVIAAYFCLTVSLSFTAWGAGPDTQWAQWRGPEANGVARHADPPLKWDENTNIKWKVEIPGRGHASPVIWEDMIIVMTAAETGKPATTPQTEETQAPEEESPGWMQEKKAQSVLTYDVIALSRKDGSTIWRTPVFEGVPHEGTHGDGSWASGSPVTDGERIYALFGSRGLHCLDMNGKPLWNKELGEMRIRKSFGEGASPVLVEDAIVVNWDHEGDSFIVAFNKKTGKEMWKVTRDEMTSWSTPVAAKVGGVTQIIASATTRIRSYNLTSGELIWECGGLTRNVVPSPIVYDDTLYAMSGFRGAELLCIDLSKARGDMTGSESIKWSYNKNTPYVPSPLLYDDMLYFLRGNSERLSCFNAKTGTENYSAQKLEGLKGVYSSPVGAAGRVYVTGRNGATAVLEHGAEFKVLTVNTLDDSFSASAALVGKEMFLRGHKAIYCIAAD